MRTLQGRWKNKDDDYNNLVNELESAFENLPHEGRTVGEVYIEAINNHRDIEIVNIIHNGVYILRYRPEARPDIDITVWFGRTEEGIQIGEYNEEARRVLALA